MAINGGTKRGFDMRTIFKVLLVIFATFAMMKSQARFTEREMEVVVENTEEIIKATVTSSEILLWSDVYGEKSCGALTTIDVSQTFKGGINGKALFAHRVDLI